MQFSQGRAEFQELSISCPSAPPLGVDRFSAPRQDTSEQTEASGVCGMQAEYVCCCHNLGLCPIGHTPCVWGSSLKPGWSPAGSRSRHGCLLVRQARGLVGSPFWGAAGILAACPGPSLLMLGFPRPALLCPVTTSSQP